ncbi:MAG: thiamine biosynthesis protein ThiF [Fibrobacter sp.]|nr:thiamine biosynthesis protein ThiF [Fibrobacter sp.]
MGSSAAIPSQQEMLAALEMRQGAEAVRKLQAATVAVCGLGGLGSNIAISLARAGVGKLVLVDFDCVDVTNLHRQQYKASQVGLPKPEALLANLKEIAPYAEFETHFEKISAENVDRIVGGAQVVCEAFDNAEAKAMLVNAVLETMPDKFLVAASGMAGFDGGNTIRTRRITDKFFLCGDGVSDVNGGIGLVAPRVMLCAAHQALTVVRLILGLE